jgi:site-specific recombinase XerD
MYRPEKRAGHFFTRLIVCVQSCLFFAAILCAKTITFSIFSVQFVRPEKEKKLPVVLSKSEVHNILKHIRFSRHKACLVTIYSLGLRIGEGTNLQVSDIDSERMFVHIHRGKGNIVNLAIKLTTATIHAEIDIVLNVRTTVLMNGWKKC